MLNPRLIKPVKISLSATLLAAFAFAPPATTRAQRARTPNVDVASISLQPTDDGAVITILADTPLTRAQTWQDLEGYHIVLLNAGQRTIRGIPPGVKVRRAGQSMEVVVATKPDASVIVQPLFNRISLLVRGGIDTARKEPAEETQAATPRRKPRGVAAPAATEFTPTWSEPEAAAYTVAAPLSTNQSQPYREATPSPPIPSPPITSATPGAAAATTTTSTPAAAAPPSTAAPASSAPAKAGQAGAVLLVPEEEDSLIPAGSDAVENEDAQPRVEVAGEGDAPSFPLYIALLVILLGAGGGLFFVLYRRRGPQEEEVVPAPAAQVGGVEVKAVQQQPQTSKESAPATPRPREVPAATRKRTDERVKSRSPKPSDNSRSLPVTPTPYGPRIVNEEVSKLVEGRPHRTDVLASRVEDDRRAIETALIEILTSPDYDEDGRRRARAALDDYGFMAYWSASVLMGADENERASSARMLGRVRAEASLPFLLEALYDESDSVRREAVASLGALELPTAINSLLDLARRHPEIPPALISDALSSCTADFSDMRSLTAEYPLLRSRVYEKFMGGMITRLHPPAPVERLPESSEDETLTDALLRLEDEDAAARAAALRTLGLYRVNSAVSALRSSAVYDPSPGARAAAVTSLGNIDHESVMTGVLIAFADEAREIRVAAARALSCFSFDRADAYVRLIEEADEKVLSDVSRACIRSGLAAQAIDRLTSADRRQAYEAFAMLSVMMRAGVLEPVLYAVENHSDNEVRLAAVRLLATAEQADVAPSVRGLLVSENIPEAVRAALQDLVGDFEPASSA